MYTDIIVTTVTAAAVALVTVFFCRRRLRGQLREEARQEARKEVREEKRLEREQLATGEEIMYQARSAPAHGRRQQWPDYLQPVKAGFVLLLGGLATLLAKMRERPAVALASVAGGAVIASGTWLVIQDDPDRDVVAGPERSERPSVTAPPRSTPPSPVLHPERDSQPGGVHELAEVAPATPESPEPSPGAQSRPAPPTASSVEQPTPSSAPPATGATPTSPAPDPEPDSQDGQREQPEDGTPAVPEAPDGRDAVEGGDEEDKGSEDPMCLNAVVAAVCVQPRLEETTEALLN